jgi:glycosyltransferase involved in cell wall biosynthesis
VVSERVSAVKMQQESGLRGGKALLSVVVPVLNEERGVRPLLDRLRPVLTATGLGTEIVFIDDGSRDGTLAELRRLNAEDPRIKVVSLSRNFGKEVAVAAGLRYAAGDAVVLMDADLQHPPEVIADFVRLWRDGYDDVYGQRLDRDTDSPARRLLSRVFYRVFRTVSGTSLPEGAGDFRLLSRRAVDALNRIGERTRFNKGLYTWIGFRSIGVPFAVAERLGGGGSRWNVRKLWRFAIDGVASFSTVPLRIWSYLGLALSIFAIVYAVVFMIKTLVFGTDLPGFPSLIVSIMMLSGVQLMSLGVMGEYLGRMYEEVKARPLFLVAEEIGIGADSMGCPAGPGGLSPTLELPAVEAARIAANGARLGRDA